MGAAHDHVLTIALSLPILLSFVQCYSDYQPYFGIIKPAKKPGMKDLRVVYSWKTVDYLFPSESSRESMIETGTYVPGAAIILDVDYWQQDGEDYIFVTMPRMTDGIPVTLGLVTAHMEEGSPLIKPYPDWSWHGEDDCEGIVSPFRMKMDECGRLWIIDSGVTDILTTAKHVCPPKIMVFDVATSSLVMKHVFPNQVLELGSLLVTIAVDMRQSGCRNAHAYVADVTQFGLIVFDSARQTSWRVNHNYFYPFPLHGSFNVAGTEFDLMDGILGLALSPLDSHGDKTLYFHSLASVRETKVSANLLRNESNFPNGLNHVSNRFYITDEVRPSQSAAQDMSKDRILFFGLLSQVSLACWNSKLPYTSHNIVTIAHNNETLQFPSGMKIVKKNGREEVMLVTSRFQTYSQGIIDPEETNYRILSGSVRDLIKGTLCDVPDYARSTETYR